MPELTIRGLPSSLANDAWWLEDTTEAQASQHHTAKNTRDYRGFAPLAILAILFLVFLADFLFWEQPIGISLVLFSAGLTVAALVSLKPRFSRKDWQIVAAVWCLAALPVIEFVQVVSVTFLVIGHAGLLVWCATRSDMGPLARAVLYLPFQLLSFSTLCTAKIGVSVFRGRKDLVTEASLLALLLPATVGAIFLSLFIGANPVFQNWLVDLLELDIPADVFARVTFWIVAGFCILPFALFKAVKFSVPSLPISRPSQAIPNDAMVNALSVRNSLVLFNAMFLMQNITDLTVLWGGSGLPADMTYAEYAHSGAYPLMATSILAGFFAIVARQFSQTSSMIKMLLLIWVAQNVLLLSSAILRLDLYINAYGLTYLRVRAGIGMFLVLAGMSLMIWQLWKSKTNAWLTGSFAAVTICVFYMCSFINFGYVIASENLSRDDKNRDTYYLCKNTPSGIKALLEHHKLTGEIPCYSVQLKLPMQQDNWRAFTLRTARIETHRRAYRAPFAEPKTQARDRTEPTPYEREERSATP